MNLSGVIGQVIGKPKYPRKLKKKLKKQGIYQRQAVLLMNNKECF